MVLLDVFWIVVSAGQVGLKVFLDVMFDAQPVDQVQYAVGVALPVGCPGHRQIVGPTDFVKVYELMGMLDNLQTGFSGEGRLQADPSEDARIVKSLQGADSVAGQLRPPFPFAAKSIVQTGEGTGESVPARAEHRQEGKGTAAAFGEGAKAESVFFQNLQRRAGKAGVKRIKRVSCEREHHLLSDSASAVFDRIFAEAVQIAGPGESATVKGRAIHLEDFWNVAVGAGVPTAAVGIGGKFGILASLTPWGVDV